ncbi:uncharacterized protein LOC119101739 [Pollicipes pollicipes]|uniref:uncharacterized protein LOC119101739 n=1 Tax=Pollicipes pollicipes TaxID=41117 RepID=UPI001885646E|nr:uncharacterized protein LOC119101739 [Pollicipes pollicipes]
MAGPPTSSCDEPDERMARLTQAAYVWCAPAICALGLAANIANLTVLRRPPLRALTVYTYLHWLSVSDLLGLLFSTLFVYLLTQETRFDRCGASLSLAFYAAHLNKPLTNMFVSASVFITLWLSANRREAMMRPAAYHATETADLAFVRIAGSLVVALALYVPMVFQYEVQLDSTLGTYVLREEEFTATKGWLAYQWLLQASVRLLPSAIIVFNNVLVARGLLAQRNRRSLVPLSSDPTPPARGAWCLCCAPASTELGPWR